MEQTAIRFALDIVPGLRLRSFGVILHHLLPVIIIIVVVVVFVIITIVVVHVFGVSHHYCNVQRAGVSIGLSGSV